MAESKKKTILLVEDQFVISAIEKQQLEEAGYRVLVTESGEESVALVFSRREPIDLILMDIDLGPGMDGTEAAKLILARHDIPLLFLSAHTEKAIVDKTETITSYGYVVKNSSFTVLDASIKMAFKLYEARRNIDAQCMDIEAAYEELRIAHESLMQTQNTLDEREKQLEENNRLLTALLDNLPIGVFMVEAPTGKPLVANEVAKQLLGRGLLPDLTKDDLSTVYRAFKGFSENIYPVDEMPIVRALNGQSSHIEDMVVEHPDGRRRLLEVFGSPVLGADNRVRASLVSFSDISERRKTQERVEGLLAEKELVLKEVQHRIKNNMGVIKSLLELQAENLGKDGNVAILHDAAGMVQSMMVLYDKLYRSESHRETSMRDYLATLIGDILGIFRSTRGVEATIDIADLVVSSTKLSSVGIIINELITNSIKYAFTGVARAMIFVSASKVTDRISLAYSDNGGGIPESVTLEKSTGFGMVLISMLVKQIGGTIRIERDSGTKIIIEFED